MSSAPTGWVAKLSGGDLLRADEIGAAIQGPGLLVVMRIDGSLKAIADHIDASGIDSKASQVLLCGSRAPHPQVQIVLLRSTLIAISLNLDHNLGIALQNTSELLQRVFTLWLDHVLVKVEVQNRSLQRRVDALLRLGRLGGPWGLYDYDLRAGRRGLLRHRGRFLMRACPQHSNRNSKQPVPRPIRCPHFISP